MDISSQQVSIAARLRTVSWRAIGCFLFLLVTAALLTVPFLTQINGYVPGPLGENRHMAAAPKPPGNLVELMKWPRQADAWLGDHFGLRDRMVSANANIRYHLFGSLSSPQLTLGRDGFIFLNSHSAANPHSAIYGLCGVPPWGNAAYNNVPALADFLRQIRERHANSLYLMVPTRTTLYPEKLPRWLQAACAPYAAPVAGALAELNRLSPDAGMVVYPLDRFQERRQTHELYPATNFHWQAETARWTAQWLAETQLNRPALRDLPASPVTLPSDLQHFMPGIRTKVSGLVVDYRAAGIEACLSTGCYPELGDVPDRLLDVSRYRAAQPGPRLLLLTDSFGSTVAGYFSAYYGEVRHFAVNHLLQLTLEERRELVRALYEDYAPDDVVFLFHDGSLLMAPQIRDWLFG